MIHIYLFAKKKKHSIDQMWQKFPKKYYAAQRFLTLVSMNVSWENFHMILQESF